MTSKKAFRKAWVDALRSGEYQQVTGQLKDTLDEEGEIVGYCCLGVLCEIAKKKGFIREYNASDEGVPPQVRKLVGLTTGDGDFARRGHEGELSLVSENDIAKKSFKQIANIIESEPKGLFVD